MRRRVAGPSAEGFAEAGRVREPDPFRNLVHRQMGAGLTVMVAASYAKGHGSTAAPA